jgi:predicted secreted Zn-dependent protease
MLDEPMNSAQLAITLVAVLVLGGAAIGVLVVGGGGSSSQTTVVATQVSATPAPPAAPTDVPPTPEAAATAEVLPDRTGCDEIRGTDYRSESERAFFLGNCISEAAPTTQQASSSPPPLASGGSTEACTASVDIEKAQSDVTYPVSGTNLDEIADSLAANAPKNEGVIAYGLTEYSYSLDGSFCGTPSTCGLGEISITATVVVTLPSLTTLDQISGEVAQLWNAYAEDVAVHEGRHVRILDEGLEEIKRMLLLIPPQPDCDALNREIDNAWTFGGSQIESRQRAFHIADAQGSGGLVVQ